MGRRAVPLPAVLAGLVGVLLLAGPVAAHPLGNFTINHYVGLRVQPDVIHLDVVLDLAEIATFEERTRLDRDEDGELSEMEIEAARVPGCRSLAEEMELSADSVTVPLELVATGISFPRGAGGLPTMRLVCGFVARFPDSTAAERSVTFTNHAFVRQPGWSEIVVQGDGATVHGDGLRIETISDRLTSYPPDLLRTPLDIRAVTFTVRPGGPTLPAWSQPDADVLPGQPGMPDAGPSPGPAAAPSRSDSLPDVFGAPSVTPAVVSLAFATAFGLGAAHALTPGHGKTIAAAWLVGTRGTRRQAIALGLSVTVAHTLGIFVLAVLIAAAQLALAPDLVTRGLPLAAALAIVAIGAWMLVPGIRRQRALRIRGGEASHDHAGHDHAAHIPADHDRVAEPRGVGWRSLFALGLAGGIVPSTSALLILLAAIASGRALFGVLLVIAFGLGMALVLGAVGIAVVHAHAWLDRKAPASVRGATTWLPVAAAAVVLAMGLWLTAQAMLPATA